MFKRLFFATTLILALKASATTWYVATNGLNSNAGTTTNAPWQTISFAASNSSVHAGDTVYVRGGVYNEAVTMGISGSKAGGYITFASYPGETAIVDGTGLKVLKNANNGLFLITDEHDIAIQGFEIRNYRTNVSGSSIVPAGIWISGASYDLTILSNRIHDIGVTNTIKGNAFGMEVSGDSATQSITNLYIHGNELYNMQTGESETFSLDGNVNGFEISGNYVHDNNNIAIGFIGYEGVCSDPNQDMTRNGVCRSNVVWDISGITNAGEDNSYDADGIYSDGGSNVLIELNLVHNCDIGIEMSSEHAGHASLSCVCRDNIVWSNNYTGIAIGGYQDTMVGSTTNCVITHNTLYHNNVQYAGKNTMNSGELLVQWEPASNIISDNIFVANVNNYFIANYFAKGSNNVVDWNIYSSTGGAAASQWVWNNQNYTGFTAYQAASTNDPHSTFTDPIFINATNLNFHLSTNSPAINAGDPNFQSVTNLARETDIDLQPRVAGGRTDIGADELNILSPTLGITPLNSTQCLLQLTGEPGHAFVWQQSTALPGGWTPFLTNPAAPLYLNGPEIISVTNNNILAAAFFQAQMTQ